MISPTYINGADKKTLHQLLRTELRGRILDVGCGSGRVKQYLAPGTTYVGMDSYRHPGVDVVGDAHSLPFEDNSFDGVICTAVLEHVENAARVITEIHRVLKPGGKVVATIPFIHHYHKDPEDYRRLSHVGLSQLFQKGGFNHVTTHMNYGTFTIVEYTFFCALVHARREHFFTRYWYLLPYYVLIGCFWIFFRILNYIFALPQTYDTSMYVGVAAVARK